MDRLAAFLRSEAGATSIEYAILAAGVALAIISAVNSLGSSVKGSWTSVSVALK
jgi:pilus assembly protein Flp/PilA